MNIHGTLFYFILGSVLFVGGTTNASSQDSWIVHTVEFAGNHVLSTNQLAAVLSTKRGEILSEAAIAGDRERLLGLYRDHAYLYAQVDSIRITRDTSRREAEVSIFLFEGKSTVLHRFELEGYRALSKVELLSALQLHEGDPFIPSLLEQDIQSILQHYERSGYPLAKAEIKNISFTDTANEIFASVQIHIDEENALHISELRVEGNKTTKDYVIAREARLRKDEPFRGDLPERIKRRLDHLQLFSSVSLPEVYITESEQAGLSVRIVEGNQNSFDGVLGYVPSNHSGESGSITGLINISLRNLFGTGRKLSARWYQENKDSRETELHYFEPWIASYPINAQIGFSQRKQDSTFVRMQYDVTGEFMVTEDFSLGASFSQTNVFPTERYDGSKVIAESKTISFGASIRYDSRDNPITPTGGILYSTEYQTGTKRTISSILFPANLKSTARRVIFDLSYYLSPFLRQVIAAQVHLRDFNSGNIDASDLFRLGGATTLRGYQEGQFLGSRLVWTNFEYRFLVAPLSFFYIFLDFGYIAPSGITAELQIPEQKKIGYGIGVRMDSALGLIGVSFALGEGDTFGTSKIHFRLINEF
jgi:outer membrane protein insertion porin family